MALSCRTHTETTTPAVGRIADSSAAKRRIERSMSVAGSRPVAIGGASSRQQMTHSGKCTRATRECAEQSTHGAFDSGSPRSSASVKVGSGERRSINQPGTATASRAACGAAEHGSPHAALDRLRLRPVSLNTNVGCRAIAVPNDRATLSYNLVNGSPLPIDNGHREGECFSWNVSRR